MIQDDTFMRYPFDLPSALEPSPEYARRRRHERVAQIMAPTGDVMWLVSGYQETCAVFKDPRFSRAMAANSGGPRPSPVQPDRRAMISTDGAEHSRKRRLVAHAFTSRAAQALHPQIQSTADQLVTAMEAQGPGVDLIKCFAKALPVSIACHLLGVPLDDQDRFVPSADIVFALRRHPVEEATRANGDLYRYVTEVITDKRRHPDDSLFGTFVTSCDRDGKPDEEELINLGIMLVVVAHQNNAIQLASAALNLLRHPEQLALLREQPELLSTAVEEVLRYNVAGDGSLVRIATDDVTLGGVHIQAGEAVLTSLIAANRDEAVFSDADRFDLTRIPNPHLTFGHGIHHCLGAPLARAQLQIGLGTLLRRLPGLRVAVSANQLPWQQGWISRTLRELPVMW